MLTIYEYKQRKKSNMHFFSSSRILVAGGAEIALKDDISGIDFVLTKKEMLDQVKAKIDTIPLVDLSYIKNTLLFVSIILMKMYFVCLSH